MTYSLTPKSDDAQFLEPIIWSFSITESQGAGECITLEKMLTESEKTGKPVIIDGSLINSVSIHKGKKPLIANDAKLHHVELRSIPFELPVRLFTPGSNVVYDMVLRAEEKSPTSFVLSNYFSDYPIKFRFIFSYENYQPPKNAGKFNITCELGRMDVTQAYQFSEFSREANESGIMGLKDSKSGKIIFISHIKDSDFNIPSKNQFDLLRKLSFIQEISGEEIPLPLEIKAGDVISIEEAYSFYKDRKVLMSPKRYKLNIGLDRNYAEEALKLAGEDGTFQMLKILEKDALMEVCGIELHLGSIEIQYPRMKTEKPINELEKELANSCEDIFNIDIVPIEDSPIILSPR